MTRVAIIGAGPSGLAALRAFESARQQGADIPELVCFERQADWGGLWNYTWRTGLDQYGEPVHGSMYRYLWSNGPKECLEFADYSFEEHFGRAIPSFPPRAVLHDYIAGRVERSGVRRYVRFNTMVKSVSWSGASQRFTVGVRDLSTDTCGAGKFDYVINASGHFSIPNVPAFEGLERFPGRVMHAHDFRDACEFAGKDLMLVGSSYSAEDIGIQCHKYGAKSVTFSYRTRPMGFAWPASFSERPLLTKVVGRTAHFKDGSTQDVDAIVLCTGYLHHYPWLPDELRLGGHNRLYPPGLYPGHLLGRAAEPDVHRRAGSVLHVQHVRCAGLVCARCHPRSPRRAGRRDTAGRYQSLGGRRGSGRRRVRRDRLPDELRTRTSRRDGLSAARC